MKSRRRNLILKLVRDHQISNQEQLQELLGAQGFDVNQGTLSRDLRGLGVVKRPTADGGARYVRAQPLADHELALANLRALLREVIASQNLLVIKTRVGGAQPVALALDRCSPMASSAPSPAMTPCSASSRRRSSLKRPSRRSGASSMKDW